MECNSSLERRMLIIEKFQMKLILFSKISSKLCYFTWSKSSICITNAVIFQLWHWLGMLTRKAFDSSPHPIPYHFKVLFNAQCYINFLLKLSFWSKKYFSTFTCSSFQNILINITLKVVVVVASNVKKSKTFQIELR